MDCKNQEIKLYKDIAKMLRKLKGANYLLAIVSNCKEFQLAISLLRLFGLFCYFHYVQLKPHNEAHLCHFER